MVRFLAAVPSVIYGLIGILVIVPFVLNNLISQHDKSSVAYVVQLDGSGIGVGILILTVMITPIMIAIVVDALRAIPTPWTEGAAALGVNRFRTLWTISVRAARPAIVAAAVLATARALGEAIMLSMVTGSVGFSPNPLDGKLFFLEPARPLAATIVDNAEGLSVEPFGQTIYAFAAILLVSSAFLSFSGWFIRRMIRRQGMTPGATLRTGALRWRPGFRSPQRGRASHEHPRRTPHGPAAGRSSARLHARPASSAMRGASGTGSGWRWPGSPGSGCA